MTEQRRQLRVKRIERIKISRRPQLWTGDTVSGYLSFWLWWQPSPGFTPCKYLMFGLWPSHHKLERTLPIRSSLSAVCNKNKPSDVYVLTCTICSAGCPTLFFPFSSCSHSEVSHDQGSSNMSTLLVWKCTDSRNGQWVTFRRRRNDDRHLLWCRTGNASLIGNVDTHCHLIDFVHICDFFYT